MRLEDTSAFQALNGQDPTFLQQAKRDITITNADGQPAGKRHSYICPKCGNGGGRNGTGMAPHDCQGHERWHCFKCGYDADIIGLYADHTGESNRLKAFRALCDSLGIPVDADWHGGQARGGSRLTGMRKSERNPAAAATVPDKTNKTNTIMEMARRIIARRTARAPARRADSLSLHRQEGHQPRRSLIIPRITLTARA